MEINSFNQEFGYELLSSIPYSYDLYLQNKLSETESGFDTESLYYFSPKHTTNTIKRDVKNTIKAKKEELPYVGIHTHERPELKFPPYKEHYKNNDYKWDKPTLCICNRYTTEWGGEPINYFDLDMLDWMFSELKKSYHIVYFPVNIPEELQDQEQPRKLNDIDVALKHNVNVFNYIKGDSWNESMLKVFANCEHYITMNGGYSILASLFGGTNIIYSKKCNELNFNSFNRWYPNHSDQRTQYVENYNELKNKITDLYIEKLPLVNVIINMSNPILFDKCMKSVLKQDYKNINIVVVTNTENNIKYSRKYNIRHIHIDPLQLTDKFDEDYIKCVNIDIVQKKVDGYIIVMDDADVLLSDDSVTTIMGSVSEDKLLVWKTQMPGKLTPKNISYEDFHNNICYHTDYVKFANWEPNNKSIKNIVKKFRKRLHVEYLDKVITKYDPTYSTYDKVIEHIEKTNHKVIERIDKNDAQLKFVKDEIEEVKKLHFDDKFDDRIMELVEGLGEKSDDQSFDDRITQLVDGLEKKICIDKTELVDLDKKGDNILAIYCAYNEIEWLPLQYEWCKLNGVKMYVVDHMSNDGTWEWLQENNIQSHRFDNGGSFHLDQLHIEMLKIIHDKKPKWVVYGDCDSFFDVDDNMSVLLEDIGKKGFDALRTNTINMYNTGEVQDKHPVNIYKYGKILERKQIRISKYSKSFDLYSDYIKFDNMKIYDKGHFINYGATRELKMKDNLVRRKKAWSEGLSTYMGKHYLELEKDNYKLNQSDLEKINTDNIIKLYILSKTNKIQCNVSQSVCKFKEQLFEKYNFQDYYNIYDISVFFGMYRKDDFELLKKHKGQVIIIWCGSDALMLNRQPIDNIEILKSNNIINIVMSDFCSQDLKQLNIKHLMYPITPTNINNIKPEQAGDNIYCYVGNDNNNFYGNDLIPEIERRTNLKIIKACHDTYNREELYDIYKKCFLGLRLTSHDGIPNTVVELGLMGRKCIYNGGLPNSIKWNNIDDICDSILKEYSNRQKININKISNDMYNYLKIDINFRNLPKLNNKLNILYIYSNQQKLTANKGDFINEIGLMTSLSKNYNVYYYYKKFESDKEDLGMNNKEEHNIIYDIAIIRANKKMFEKLSKENMRIIYLAVPVDEECFKSTTFLNTMTQVHADYLKEGKYHSLYNPKCKKYKNVISFQQVVRPMFKKLEIKNTKFTIGCIGRFVDVTYPHLLFSALNNLKNIFDDYEILIGSNTSFKITPPNDSHIKILKHTENVIERYNKCDVTFVGQWGEEWQLCGNLKVLESMACGIPIILERSPAREEMLWEDYPYFLNKNSNQPPINNEKINNFDDIFIKIKNDISSGEFNKIKDKLIEKSKYYNVQNSSKRLKIHIDNIMKIPSNFDWNLYLNENNLSKNGLNTKQDAIEHWLNVGYKKEIFASVAMPLFNMGQISTLALESLCNQKTRYKWELIVCEELYDNPLGEKKLMEYEERLKMAGCIRIKYIGIEEWIPLGQKWKVLSENASDTKCFILQAGDCYAHEHRIEKTCKAFNKGYNYYDEDQGYFYSYRLNKTILFKPVNNSHPCRLNMAWDTSLFKKLPNNDTKKNVDNFLYVTFQKIEKIEKYRNYDLHIGVDVDGYNIISSRDTFFLEKNDIFKSTDIDITEKLPILNKYKKLKLTKRFKDE